MNTKRRKPRSGSEHPNQKNQENEEPQQQRQQRPQQKDGATTSRLECFPFSICHAHTPQLDRTDDKRDADGWRQSFFLNYYFVSSYRVFHRVGGAARMCACDSRSTKESRLFIQARGDSRARVYSAGCGIIYSFSSSSSSSSSSSFLGGIFLYRPYLRFG